MNNITRILVCPAYKHAYKDDQLSKFGLDKNTFRSEFNFTSSDGVTAWEVFHDITHEFIELVDNVEVTLRKSQLTESFNISHFDSGGLVSGEIIALSHHELILLNLRFGIQERLKRVSSSNLLPNTG